MRRFVYSLISLAILNASYAQAGDRVLRLTTGGLAIEPQSSIEVLEQELTISIDLIKSHLILRNPTYRSQRINLTFALPVIDGDDPGVVALPFAHAPNFVGFKLWFNDRLLEPHVEERAFVNETDVTALLKRHGITLNPANENKMAAFKKRSNAAQKEFSEAATYEIQSPFWKYEVTLSWSLEIPAEAKPIKIRYSYQPVRGWHQQSQEDLKNSDYRTEYCIAESMATQMRSALSASRAMNEAYEISLDLSSVNTTLKALQSRFILTLETKPGIMLSTCLPGLQKSSPTAYQWLNPANSVPENLSILFVRAR